MHGWGGSGNSQLGSAAALLIAACQALWVLFWFAELLPELCSMFDSGLLPLLYPTGRRLPRR